MPLCRGDANGVSLREGCVQLRLCRPFRAFPRPVSLDLRKNTWECVLSLNPLLLCCLLRIVVFRLPTEAGRTIPVEGGGLDLSQNLKMYVVYPTHDVRMPCCCVLFVCGAVDRHPDAACSFSMPSHACTTHTHSHPHATPHPCMRTHKLAPPHPLASPRSVLGQGRDQSPAHEVGPARAAGPGASRA